MTEIQKRREGIGLSRKELAKEVGVTYNAILLYELEEREPKASILKKIAQSLGCAMEDLI